MYIRISSMWIEIWMMSRCELSFLLRATYNVLPTPVNLKSWRLTDDSKCHECGLHQDTWDTSSLAASGFSRATSPATTSCWSSLQVPSELQLTWADQQLRPNYRESISFRLVAQWQGERPPKKKANLAENGRWLGAGDGIWRCRQGNSTTINGANHTAFRHCPSFAGCKHGVAGRTDDTVEDRW